jgi:hypothetical protein
VVLRRADYARLCNDVARAVAALESPDEMLDEACRRLAPALSAREVRWSTADEHRVAGADLERAHDSTGAGVAADAEPGGLVTLANARGFERHSDTTLGEEMELVESYLDIERARFEERLRVRLEVVVSAELEPTDGRPGSPALRLTVRDTGVGASEVALLHGRKRGVGLANVERRLECHYGTKASLSMESVPGMGTTVIVRLPAPTAEPSVRSEGAHPVGRRSA